MRGTSAREQRRDEAVNTTMVPYALSAMAGTLT
ncbi:MAG: hypothetical protein RLZZ450_4924, partial [Pseudomonadota bacterium]